MLLVVFTTVLLVVIHSEEVATGVEEGEWDLTAWDLAETGNRPTDKEVLCNREKCGSINSCQVRNMLYFPVNPIFKYVSSP